VSYGSYNQKRGSLGGRKNIDKFFVEANGDFLFSDGSRDVNTSDKKDNSYLKRALGKVGFVGDMFLVEGGISQYNSYQKYANAMGKSQFDSNPGGMGVSSMGLNYSDQSVAIREYSTKVAYYPNSNLLITLPYGRMEKSSRWLNPWSSDFRYINDTLKPTLSYDSLVVDVDAGAELFGGSREDSSDKTTQSKQAYFLKLSKNISSLNLEGGARYEETKYDYNPNIGSSLDQSKSATNYELRAEYAINKNLLTFAGFQEESTMPDIDRFFAYDFTTNTMSFNGFIEPQRMRTYEAGAAYEDEKLELKGTLFYIDGKNEFYYYQSPVTFAGYNTNLDKTEKKGVELEAKYALSKLTLRGLYSYIDAKILKEDSGSGAYDDKTMPGVYKHNLKLGADVDIVENLVLSGDFAYATDAYVANDLGNSFAQKQKDYSSLDFALRYGITKNYELYAEAQNVLGYKNGYFVSDNVIYPYNFETSFRVGGKISY